MISLLLTILIYYLATNRIGDIAYDKNIDNSDFMVCNQDRIMQDYNFRTHYQGGEKAIKKELSELIENLTFKNSGYITFRFIVNCQGKIGRFRLKTVNSKLKENNFNSQKIKTIQESIQKLNNWNPGVRKNEKLDSYYVLNFKITNNKITDIF